MQELYHELCERYGAEVLTRSRLDHYGGRNASMGSFFLEGDDLAILRLFPDWISLSYYVGGCSASPSGLLVGHGGTVGAFSSHRTPEQIERDRVQRIGTAIPGWDIPGLRWRVSAVAPMSRTAVPFMGRIDQYLVCRDPTPHIVAERRTLAGYRAHPGDPSQYRGIVA